MAIPASSPFVLYREFRHREQQTSPSSSAAATCGALLPVTPGGSGSGSGIFPLAGRKLGWKRRRAAEVRAGAFWISKPTSVVMEEITTMEEMDEALRRSQELSQLLIIDWMASWCRKCIYLKPKLEKLAAEFYPRVKFYFVDVNKVPQALVKRANISVSLFYDINKKLKTKAFYNILNFLNCKFKIFSVDNACSLVFAQKMPTIQLWKDGEWNAEIIGGHKAWLVIDEVREMVQNNS